MYIPAYTQSYRESIVRDHTNKMYRENTFNVKNIWWVIILEWIWNVVRVPSVLGFNHWYPQKIYFWHFSSLNAITDWVTFICRYFAKCMLCTYVYICAAAGNITLSTFMSSEFDTPSPISISSNPIEFFYEPWNVPTILFLCTHRYVHFHPE